MIDIKSFFKQIVGRQPEAAELDTVSNLLARTPEALRDDPGLVADVIIRSAHLSEMNRCVDKLMIGMRDYAQSQSESYAMAVADKVWRRIMDNLPWNVQTEATGRIRRYAVILGILFLLGFISGWSCLYFAYQFNRQSHQAAQETTFLWCVEGAVGASVTAAGKAAKAGVMRVDVFANRARQCAAEYADWRATGL